MKSTLSKKATCEHCGTDNISHTILYINVLIDLALGRLMSAQSNFPPFNLMSRWGGRIEPHIFKLLIRTGIAKGIFRPDNGTQLLAKMLWEEAEKREIHMTEFRLFGLARNMFFAKFKNGKIITFEGIPLPALGKRHVWWIDDKAILKKEFQRHGFPVANGSTVSNTKEALSVYKNLSTPVIVKPRKGSGSRHTTLHIADETKLLDAFAVAKEVSPHVVIEEELKGSVYRATVVDGKLIATLRRDQPHVVGDGVSTILELIHEANKHPARSGPYFSKIKIDENALNELKWHGCELNDILPKGECVTFHQKVNWSVGGTTKDVTDEVHPDNIALFERTAKILYAPIVGIDFIIEHIDRSWKVQEKCGILECNSMPFFDNHHLPFEGKSRNVAAAIWDMVENQSKVASRK